MRYFSKATRVSLVTNHKTKVKLTPALVNIKSLIILLRVKVNVNLKQSSAMAEAMILSSKPKCKDINKYHELDDEWYSLGVELDIEDEESDDLEESTVIFTRDI